MERGFEPPYTALQAAASPLGHSTVGRLTCLRADDGTRTRDPHLGKVMLYQLSHIRVEASASCVPGCSPATRSKSTRPSWPSPIEIEWPSSHAGSGDQDPSLDSGM